jgi:hypothetical protein
MATGIDPRRPPQPGQSLQLFEQAMKYRDIVRTLLLGLLDSEGRVRGAKIRDFHDHICSSLLGFVLRDRITAGVLKGGYQLFYVNGPILVRVKTTGTEFRPRPHMTVSLADGLAWPNEVAKFNRDGVLVPRLSPVKRAYDADLMRSLERLEKETGKHIADLDNFWANNCHFDFVPGFDVSEAADLPVIPAASPNP